MRPHLVQPRVLGRQRHLRGRERADGILRLAQEVARAEAAGAGGRGRRLLCLLPCAILLAVATVQAWLVASADLSPWSGGGFGMFSTTDAGPTRHLHAFVLRPGIMRELALPPELTPRVGAAVTLPSEANLRALALAVAELPTPDHGPATAVSLQIWQVRHDPVTLAPHGRLLRGFELALPVE